MAEYSLNPDEVEVEAEFFLRVEDKNSPLVWTQLQLREVMSRRGYDILHKGSRVWEFIHQQRSPKPGLLWRFRERLGLVNDIEHQADQYLENLRDTRNDHPIRIKFRFIPTTMENGDEGYIVEVECIPALREKYYQLPGDFSDVDPESAVRTSKSLLRDIATEAGFSIFTEPFTPANNYRATLDTHLRKQLQEYKYGFQIVHFADDADQALKYSLNRPALSAYFHGIEWAIIAFIEEEENRDIIEDEAYGRGKGFPELVNDLKETHEVRQTTYEALESMNTERIWMAHHKEGHVSDIEVRRVKQRFSIMLEELFL